MTLTNLVEELQSEAAELKLKFSLVERIVLGRLSTPPPDGKGALQYLSESFYRACDEDSFFRTLPQEVKAQVPGLLEQIGRFASLYILVPSMFGLPDQIDGTHLILNALDFGMSPRFLERFVAELEGNETGCLKRVFGPVVEQLCKRICGRTLSDPRTGHCRVLTILASNKMIAKVIPQLACFDPSANMLAFQKSMPGYALMSSSLLGGFLSPSPLDWGLLGPGKEAESARHKYFQGVSTKPRPVGIQAQNTLRGDLEAALTGTHTFLMALLKAGAEEERLAIFYWFAKILRSMESKAKLASMFGQDAAQAMPGMEALLIRASGQVTGGFGLNVFWLLAALAEPIKVEQVGDVDAFYALRADCRNLVGYMNEKELPWCVGAKEQVQKALAFYQTTAGSKAAAKPKSHFFWLAAKAFRVLFKPSVGDYRGVLNKVVKMQQQGPAAIRGNPLFDKVVGEMYCYDVCLFGNHMSSVCGHLINLILTHAVRSLYLFDPQGTLKPDVLQFLQSKGDRISALIVKACPPPVSSEMLPPQFAALPGDLIEDVMEVVQNCLWFRKPSVLTYLDLDLVVAVLILVLESGNVFKNAALRAKAAQVIQLMSEEKDFKSRVELAPVAQTHLLSALITFYGDCEKSGGFYQRVNYRATVTHILESLLHSHEQRESLKKFASSREEDMVRFVHALLSDLGYLLEEGMETLGKIKERLQKGEKLDDTQDEEAEDEEQQQQQQEQAQQQQQQQRQQNDEDEPLPDEVMDGPHENVEQLPLRSLQRNCKSLLQLGLRTLRLLWRVSKEAPETIVNLKLVLPNVVATLNGCIDRLVGPKCLRLKVDNYEQFEFKPRDLLSYACETYVYLARADNYGVIPAEIVNEGRYYKPETFSKAIRILKRESIIPGDMLRAFEDLTTKLQDAGMEQKELEEILDSLDIPDEFLDPVMSELMTDPVMLPSSKKIMDRKHVEKHLLSDDHDPFNRSPLKASDLIPQPELKQQIEAWVKEALAKAGKG